MAMAARANKDVERQDGRRRMAALQLAIRAALLDRPGPASSSCARPGRFARLACQDPAYEDDERQEDSKVDV